MHPNLKRLTPNSLEVDNHVDLQTIMFANGEVPIDNKGVDEYLSFINLLKTIDELKHLGYFEADNAEIDRCVLTPDFHKGAGIPIGTVFSA